MDSFGATDPTTHELSQISAILNSDDTFQFETLISDLMSPANDERSKAQKLFHLGKQHHPNALVLKLCQLLPVSSKRAMCAVLLRVILTIDSSSGEDGIYTHLSGNTQSALHRTLIECVVNETNKSVLKKVRDTVSELAAIVLPGYGWYSFLGYMFKWVTSDIDRHRESALLIFAQLVQYIGGLLVPRLEELHQAFLECLDRGMVADVRIAAFNASINFIRYLEEASDRDKFHDLIPLMMQTLNEALVWNESTARESMLKLLIELAGMETFVYEGIDEVVEAMLRIAEAENLEEGTKHLALEFVVTLAEAREEAPAMINKLSELVKRLFEVLMKMLSDVEDDPDWHRAEIEQEDAGETNNYIVGQEYLDRLWVSLGGNIIVPVIFEIFPTYLAAPEWQKHHAEIIALAQIAKGCTIKVMTRNLKQVVSMILNSFKDPHPRSQTLNEALVRNESTARESMLKFLIVLAETETFAYEGIVEVVEAMLQIAETENLEEGTKHLALEFVVTLAEARERAPWMIRKLPQCVKRLFEVLMKMLLDVEDDPDWHRAEIEHEDAGETSNIYSAGKDFVYSLSISLGGNTIVPVIFEIFPAYLAAPDHWQKHHAALIALAQIAEGCSEVMKRNWEQVVSMILNSFRDPHPRVRWAAIKAICQLSTNLGPDLQNEYYNLVFPALASIMDDFHNIPRMQVHATLMVLNFSKNCPPRVLRPYLDGIVRRLLVLLQNINQMVQEGALTALALVHLQSDYDEVMPYLRDILVNNANDNANRMLRAKSMKCICLVGMAVEFDKFKDDVKLVMDVLHGSQLETDDPTISYLSQSWAGYQEFYGNNHKCPELVFLLYLCYFMRWVRKPAQDYNQFTLLLKPIFWSGQTNI